MNRGKMMRKIFNTYFLASLLLICGVILTPMASFAEDQQSQTSNSNQGTGEILLTKKDSPAEVPNVEEWSKRNKELADAVFSGDNDKVNDILQEGMDPAMKEFVNSLSVKKAWDNAKLCVEFQNNSSEILRHKDDDPLSGKGIMPDAVLQKIYNTTYKMSTAVGKIMAMGHAVMCQATHAFRSELNIADVIVVRYTNIPMWFCGIIVYFIGFMITLSVVFYLVDIGFKLGFAVIMLPVAIALWPFPPTKDKLPMIISIILKSAAIFAFLSLTITYTFNLIDHAVGGIKEFSEMIDNNDINEASEKFSLFSMEFLLIVFALAYGMRLIGNTIPDYVDAFFSDQVFGNASPIHGSMTQAMDFAKKKAVAPVAKYAKDVAKTQTGNLMKGSGKLISGGYNQQIKRGFQLMTNPKQAAKLGVGAAGRAGAKLTDKVGKGFTGLVSGTLGRLVLGNNASKALQAKANAKIDQAASKIHAASSNLTNQANQNLAAKTAAAAAASAQRGPGPVSRFMDRRKSRIDQISAERRAKMDSITQKKLKSFASIDKIEQKALNFVDKWTGMKWMRNKQNSVSTKAAQKRQQQHAALDAKYQTNANDSIFKKGYKATMRGTGKLYSNAKYGAKKLGMDTVATVAKIPGTAAKVGVVALGQVAKLPARGLSSARRAKVSIDSGRKKFVHRAARVVVKTVNVKTWAKGAGQVMMTVGDQMTRNGKTAEQIAAEQTRKKAENEEWERQRRERENS